MKKEQPHHGQIIGLLYLQNSKENEASADGLSYEMEEMAGAAEPTKAHLVSKVAKKVSYSWTSSINCRDQVL